MTMRKFFIRTKKLKGMATLYVRIQKRNPAINLMINSRIQVDIEAFNKRNFYNTAAGKEVFRKEERIDALLDALMNKGVYDKRNIDEAISDLVYSEENDFLQKREEQKKVRMEHDEERRRKDVILYLENYYKGIKSGAIKTDNETYTRNTVKNWHTFMVTLKRFYAGNPFSWDDVNKALINKFTLFVEEEGYLPTSINKYLTCFRALMGYSLADGYHANMACLTMFKKKKITELNKQREIYLTANELNALYEMKLTGLCDKARDVFLVGCYTCQRFSDYSRLEPGNFTITAKGTKVVRIEQKKTKNPVVIPILNDNLLAIARKYDFQIPAIIDVVLNRKIKEILKDLSAEVPSLAKRERTILNLREKRAEEQGKIKFERDTKGYVVKPRYELVTTHTARRTGITLLYLSGLFDTIQMMSISGHKTEKTFLDYIKLSSDELADMIAKKAGDRKELF